MLTKSIVFIETGPKPMEQAGEHASVLLLERPPTTAREGAGDLGAERPPREHGDEATARPDTTLPTDVASALRSPGLALLAAISILEGYRWLGVIPAGGSRGSALSSGRPGAMLFCGLALPVAVALTRAAGRRRSATQTLVALAAAGVGAATLWVVVADGVLARATFGTAAMGLAAAAIGALIASERRKRAAEHSVSSGSSTQQFRAL
jgi:hypothetical protein